MIFEFQYVAASFKVAVRYIPVTLALSVIPLVIGIVLGTLIAIVRRFRVRFIGRAADMVIPVVKGIPLVLHIFIMNFLILKPFDALAKWYSWADIFRFMDKTYIGIIALAVYAVVIVSETMRSALLSVNDGQYEACYSVGLTKWQALRRVVLPQAFPFAVPVLCNNFIGLIKGSSIVYLITVVDVLNGALTSAQINYRFLEAYIAAALIYWAMCLLVEKFSDILEKYFKRYQFRLPESGWRREVL
ncbi:amino acid ABC transporter permease [Acetonema longum]|uniref:Amino acid ABC transporter membrane protein n=1 Tax=Acetonema longum DSM 6540 TaxID=1009370 RepID=F7NJ84_9FIRM|nr:amino acid ABC transporter permease [Acetonema longum]EGO63832.1 amino acid ABC transporter membrane protein [Acetonema longum DSM 6540]